MPRAYIARDTWKCLFPLNPVTLSEAETYEQTFSSGQFENSTIYKKFQ